MAGDRPEKKTVREIWLQAATGYSEAFDDDPHPLFLTLGGAEGRDIQLLIDNHLLELTETGAISAEMKHRVIAVESSSRAAAALQIKYPGLKILEEPFQNLLSGESLIRFPRGEHEEFCCARVVNLDLNEPLMVANGHSLLDFPILKWVRKLCQLHAQHDLDWTLCLTLHGETVWGLDVSKAVRDFLVENFGRELSFADACRDLFEDELFELVSADTAVDFGLRAYEDQQRLLMAFVPKKIAQLVHHDGWRVETSRNLRYGGTAGRAPMVTWVIDFVWDPSTRARPDATYRQALAQVLSGAGRIEEDGTIS
jgi:hypothetical protein